MQNLSVAVCKHIIQRCSKQERWLIVECHFQVIGIWRPGNDTQPSISRIDTQKCHQHGKNNKSHTLLLGHKWWLRAFTFVWVYMLFLRKILQGVTLNKIKIYLLHLCQFFFNLVLTCPHSSVYTRWKSSYHHDCPHYRLPTAGHYGPTRWTSPWADQVPS